MQSPTRSTACVSSPTTIARVAEGARFSSRTIANNPVTNAPILLAGATSAGPASHQLSVTESPPFSLAAIVSTSPPNPVTNAITSQADQRPRPAAGLPFSTSAFATSIVIVRH